MKVILGIHRQWTNDWQVLHQKLDHVCHLLGSFPVPLAEGNPKPESKQSDVEKIHQWYKVGPYQL